MTKELEDANILCPMTPSMVFTQWLQDRLHGQILNSACHTEWYVYRNTIAGSCTLKRIFIYFWKNKGSPLKNWISQFLFFSKKISKMTLNSLEVTKCGKNQFILFSFFCLQIFLFFTFLFIFRIIFARTNYAATVLVEGEILWGVAQKYFTRLVTSFWGPLWWSIFGGIVT